MHAKQGLRPTMMTTMIITIIVVMAILIILRKKVGLILLAIRETNESIQRCEIAGTIFIFEIYLYNNKNNNDYMGRYC